MDIPKSKRPKFVAGGNVQSGGGIYVRRDTDDQLLELCRKGEFAYVLTSRQMGKSSLMVNTKRELDREGAVTASIDLTMIGARVSPEQWYRGLLLIVENQLALDTDASAWWDARQHLGFTQRLVLFFQEVVLKEVPAPRRVVIFVDEIDSTLSFHDAETGTSFTDDFFAAIRAFYNDRSINPDIERLSFVLIGVATPTDLIQDARRTPFNIGHRIDLNDFTLAQAAPLATGFDLPPGEAEQVLRWVFHWTGGHPFLTQRLCQELAARQTGKFTEQDVNNIAEEIFLGEKGEQVSNLTFVRDMLTRPDRVPNGDLGGVLQGYREILTSRRPIADEEKSQIKSYLKLSGVVRRENSHLQVRNRIYRHVFNDRWAKEHLSTFVGKKVLRYRRRAALAVAAMLVFAALYGYTRWQWQKTAAAEIVARAAEAEAKQNAETALKATEQEKKAKLDALDQSEKARVAKEEAIKQKRTADEATERARSDAQIAKEQRKKAQQATFKANWSAGVATQQKDRAVAATLIAGMATSRAVTNESRAVTNERRAVKASAISDSQSRAASSMQALATNPDDSLATALHAANAFEKRMVAGPKDEQDKNPPAETQEALRRSYLESRRRILINAPQPISGIAYGPASVHGGYYVVTASDDNVARVWHVNSEHPERTRHVADLGYTVKEQEKSEVIGHAKEVQSGAFSSCKGNDKCLIVTASYDHTAAVWEFPYAEIEENVRLYHQGDSKNCSPEKSNRPPFCSPKMIGPAATLGARFDEGQLDDGKQENKKERLQYAAFSPDDKFIVTASRNGTAVIWEDTSNGGRPAYQRLRDLKGHTDVIYSAFYDRVGKHIVTASADKTARVWDAATGKCLQTLRGHLDAVRQAVFNYDGDKVATAGKDNLAIIWDWKNATPTPKPILRGHTDDIWSIAYNWCGTCSSEEREQVITTSADRTARVWDTRGEGSLIAVLKGHKDTIWRAAFAPDGKHVITASDDHTARTWEIVKDRNLISFKSEGVSSTIYAPDGQMIVVAAQNGAPSLWDASTGQKLATLLPPNNGFQLQRCSGQQTSCRSFLSWNKNFLVALHETKDGDWQALAWRTSDLKSLYDAAKAENQKPKMAAPADRHNTSFWQTIREFLFGRKSQMVNQQSSDTKTVLGVGGWHLEDLSIRDAYLINSDKNDLIVVSQSGGVKSAEITAGAELVFKPGKERKEGEFTVAFSRNGEFFITADREGTLRRLKAETWEECGRVRGEGVKSNAKFICTLDCAKALILADGELKEVDFQRRAESNLTAQVRTSNESEVEVLNASYSGKDNYILASTKVKMEASGSEDWNVKVLDADRKITSILRGHIHPIISALSSPDEEYALTASFDGVIRISPKFMFTAFPELKRLANEEKGQKVDVNISQPK